MVNCPPGRIPSITRGARFASALYKAAVSPAGPEPRISTFVWVGLLFDMAFVDPFCSDIFPSQLLIGELMKKLSHVDAQGRARMVDVAEKPVTHREAIATGTIHLTPE